MAVWTRLEMEDQSLTVLRASHQVFRIAQVPCNDGFGKPTIGIDLQAKAQYALLVAGGTSLDLRPVGAQALPQASSGSNEFDTLLTYRSSRRHYSVAIQVRMASFRWYDLQCLADCTFFCIYLGQYSLNLANMSCQACSQGKYSTLSGSTTW